MFKIRENGFAVALAAGLALALVVGMVYVLAAGRQRVAAEAEALHVTHQVIQSASVARGQLELAAYQASLAHRGVAIDESAGDAAVDRAGVALDAGATSAEALGELGELSAGAAAAWQRFTEASAALLQQVEGGNPASTDIVDEAYSNLISELSEIRDRFVGGIAGAERASAWISATGGFLAVFAIPAGVITAYFLLDRRRRRQHELEVTLNAERAAQASRESFLTAVSHQLREPLWAVRGISRMLGNDEVLMAQPRMSDLHLLLAGELDDMNGLMDNLLTASRLEAGALDYSMEPIDARDAARTLIDSLDHRGASIYVAMDDGVVNADRRYLRQILRNLISNALKYGGPNIEVKGNSEADRYSIVIVDDGQGVPPAVEGQLFTRFVHGDRDSQNVGLGLSIVMALAVGMGGTAFYRREDGLSRFGVVLPSAAAPSIPSALYEPPTITPVSRPLN